MFKPEPAAADEYPTFRRDTPANQGTFTADPSGSLQTPSQYTPVISRHPD